MARSSRSEDCCKYALGDDAIAYLKERLADGGSIARSIATSGLHDAFTFFCCGLSQDELSQYAVGRRWRLRDAVWQDWISRFLTTNSSSVAVAEVFGLSPTSPALAQRSAIWCIREEIVAFADGSPTASVQRLFRNMSPYPSIVLLCDDGRDLVGKTTPSPDDLVKLASGASSVLVGAYDEESFVSAKCAQ